MYEKAKSAREAMKAKAKRLASGPAGKVDASSYTTPDDMHADVKTGMRPVSRRAFKSGGKVTGEESAKRADRAPRKSDDKAEAKDIAIAKVNRDVKAANAERDGVKHVGGMKSGGRAKKQQGGPAPEAGEPRPAPKNPVQQRAYGAQDAKAGKMAQEAIRAVGSPGSKPVGLDKDQVERLERGYKKGGRAKKMGGGQIAGMLGLRPVTEVGDYAPVLNGLKDKDGKKHGGRAKRASGGEVVPVDTKAGKPVIPGMKKGGKAGHEDEAADKALIEKMVKKDARVGKYYGGAIGKAEGGEIAKKKTKGATNINIVIAAGGKPSDAAPAGAMPPPPGGAPPPGIPVPVGDAPDGPPGGPQPMPMPIPMPMPMGGLPGGGPGAGPGMPPIPGRKAGGRVTKSYMKSKAGAGSGLGRLHKAGLA